jgi:uncharacterized protein YegL
MPFQWQSHRQRFLICCTLLIAVTLFIQPSQVVQTQENEQNPTILLDIDPIDSAVAVGSSFAVNLKTQADASACPSSGANTALDLVLVIDHSGSMGGVPMREAKEAVINFIKLLNPKKDRVAVVVFDHTSITPVELTNDFNRAIVRVQSIAATGTTNIGLGLQKGLEALTSARSDAQKVVVLFTDGVDTAGFFARASAARIKKESIPLLTIGFGAADKALLTELETTPADALFASSATAIREQFTRFGTELAGRIAARNIVVKFKVNTAAYAIEKNVISGATVSDTGEIEWRIPLLTDGKLLTLPIVLRPLKAGQAPLGTTTIEYQPCDGDGGKISTEVKDQPVIAVSDAFTDVSLFQAGSNLPLGRSVSGLLTASGQTRWLVDVPESRFISLWVEGAGSKTTPLLANSKESGIAPLYTLRDVGKTGRTLHVYSLKEAGTHWLTLQSAGAADIGRYSLLAEANIGLKVDELPELDTSSLIEVKQDVRGTAYRINEPAGQLITLRAQFKFGFGELRLVDSKTVPQTVQAVDFITARATLVNVFELSGTPPYVLFVQPDFSFARQATYTLGLEHGDSVRNAAGELRKDEEERGVLEAGKQDAWTFEGKSNDVVQIVMTGVTATMLLHDPDGELLAVSNTSVIEAVRLPSDGKYTITLLAGQRQEGSYGLTLKSGTITAPAEIAYGSKAISELKAGEIVNWQFKADANDAVIATITSENFNLTVELVDVKGNVISRLDRPAGNSARFEGIKLPEAGMYSVRIRATTNAEEGRYTLALDKANNIPMLNLEDVSNGSLGVGERDLWQFEGGEGDTISLLGKSKTAQLFLELNDPQGVPVTDSVFQGLNVGINRFTLPKDGTYTLIVMSNTVEAGGDYEIKFELDPALQGSVTVGETVKGTRSNNFMAAYEVKASADQTISLILKTPFTATYPIMLDSNGMSIIPEASVIGPKSTLVVYKFGGEAPFKFLFRMNGQFELSAVEGNVAKEEKGTIKLNEQIKDKTTDYARIVSYKLDIPINEIVSLQIDNRTNKRVIPLQVVDSKDNLLSPQHASQLDGVTTAVYRMEGDAPFTASFGVEGDYTLITTKGDILRISQPTLPVGEKVAGKITAPANQDLYTLDMQAGQVISIELEQRQGKIDATLRDAKGKPLTPDTTLNFNRINTTLVYTLTGIAPYRLTIETQNTYGITLREGDSTAIKMDKLNASEVVTGQLKAGQRAFYPIDIKVGEELLIVVTNSRKTQFNLTILDSKNRSLLVAAESVPLQMGIFTAVPGGEGPHTLVLQTEGNYQIIMLPKSAVNEGISVKVKSSVSLKAGPGSTFNPAGSGKREEVFKAVGRSADNKWLMVVTPDGGLAWLEVTRLDPEPGESELASLPEISVRVPKAN